MRGTIVEREMAAAAAKRAAESYQTYRYQDDPDERLSPQRCHWCAGYLRWGKWTTEICGPCLEKGPPNWLLEECNG